MSACCLDTSAWIEIFHGGPQARIFLKALGDPTTVIVPVACLYEIWKYTMLHADEARARNITQSMSQGSIVPIDSSLALAASSISLKYKLPMADAFIYATALCRNAILWTQDRHFEGLPHVRCFPKTNR